MFRFGRTLCFWALLLFVASACVLAIALLSSTYQACVADEHAHYPSQKQQSPLSRIGVLVRCEAAPLDKHAGSLTAIGTFAIAVFTLTLWKVTDRTLRLARDEFNATHRPKIFVQTVSVTNDGESVGRYPAGNETRAPEPCEGIITVANGGDSPAFIIEWQSIVYLQLSGMPFKPPLDIAVPQRPKPDTPGISPGVIESMKHSQTKPVDQDWRTLRQGEGHRMFFIGRILYEGPDKVRRSTGFCREWDKALGSGRWKPTDYSEYEYAY